MKVKTENAKWSGRILAVILTLFMTINMMPTVSYAAGNNKVQIGNTEYYNLETAIGAAAENDTITLIADNKLSKEIEITKKITLDLNGYIIDGDQKCSLFLIREGGDLTLKDSSAAQTGKLTGGEYDGNGGGGAIDVAHGSLTMESGSIEGNECTSQYGSGGGVYVNAGGTFIMNGGTIKNNSAYYGGGVYVVSNGTTFTMNGGTITGNTAFKRGGGIESNTMAQVTISGSSVISNNTAKTGGGISLTQGNVTITGGTITGNTANGTGTDGMGGGVYVYGNVFKMTGGTITGNTANTKGGGVYFADGTLQLGGTPNITGNLVSNKANNLYLENEKKFNLVPNEDLQTGTEIGISVATLPTAATPTTITLKRDYVTSSFNGFDYVLPYFSSDNPLYELGTAENQLNDTYIDYYLNLVLGHTHEWAYTASGNKLTAICTSAEECNHQTDATAVVLTLTAQDVTDAELAESNPQIYSTDAATSWTETGLIAVSGGNAAVTYEGINGTVYDSANKPTTVGDYRVKYTITNGNDTYMLSDDFTISDGTKPSGKIILPGDEAEYDSVGEAYSIVDKNKYNSSITVNITATDNEGGSGVDTIAYYIQNIPVGEESVTALDDEGLTSAEWNNLTIANDSVPNQYKASITIDSDIRGVIYARIKDKAGNVKYISTSGVGVDVLGPEFVGIVDGNKYSTDTIKFSVTDASQTTVTCKKDDVDYEAPNFTYASGEYTIKAGERTSEETYIITATDEYAHVSTCTIIISKKYLDKENNTDAAGFIATAVQVEQGTPSAEVDNLSVAMVKDNILTPEEKASVTEDGKEIIILLGVSKETNLDSDIEIGIRDKVTEVYDEAGNGCQFLYLNLELSKIMQTSGIPEGTPEAITDTNGAELGISLDIPQELINTDSRINRMYFIVRSHQAQDNTFTYDIIPSTFNKSTGKLTFASSLFSVYGISYIDEPVQGTPGTPSGHTPSSSVSENTVDKTVDKTADKLVETASGDISEERSREILETAKKSNFSRLQPVAKNNTKNSVTLNWKEETEADGYMIYGNLCNHDGNKYKLEYIKTVDKSELELTLKGLKKGTYYKYQIVAFRMIDGKRVAIAKTPIVHTVTKGGKYGVAKAIRIAKIGKKSYNTEENVALKLKKGKSIKVSAKEIKEDKTIQHHRNVLYVSDNKKVATVDKKGQIIAKGKGTCTIYIYAQNGVYNTITVTVP